MRCHVAWVRHGSAAAAAAAAVAVAAGAGRILYPASNMDSAKKRDAQSDSRSVCRFG